MSLSSKFRQAEGLLSAHYKGLGAEDKTEELLAAIREMGGTTEAALEEISATDLENLGLPKLLARKVAKAFGSSGESGCSGEKQIVIVDDNPVNLAARLKPEDLVAEYDPNDPTNPFGVRLKQISSGQPFLVFESNNSGVLLIGISAQNLRELLDGYPPRATVLVDGVLHQTFPVGGRPARYADEHPLMASVMLRPSGHSDNHVEWGAVPLSIRQLVRLALASKEVELTTPADERDVYEDVQGKTFDQLSARWPRAAVQFKELEGAGNLPALKIVLKPQQQQC